LKAKQTVAPKRPIKTPPTTGPTIREKLKAAAVRATALWSCARGTSVGASERRAGQSKPEAAPMTTAMTMMCQTRIEPVAVNTARAKAAAAETHCTIRSTRRRSIRSRTAPAIGAETSCGAAPKKLTRPSKNLSWVSS
jgi:hypothetical protein